MTAISDLTRNVIATFVNLGLEPPEKILLNSREQFERLRELVLRDIADTLRHDADLPRSDDDWFSYDGLVFTYEPYKPFVNPDLRTPI